MSWRPAENNLVMGTQRVEGSTRGQDCLRVEDRVGDRLYGCLTIAADNYIRGGRSHGEKGIADSLDGEQFSLED